MTAMKPSPALETQRLFIVGLVRRDGRDLSARQLAVLLTVYLTAGPHTVRGLAVELKVAKPAITRALDRLSTFNLIRRQVDPTDRRNVLIYPALFGSVFLREMESLVAPIQQAA